jgi:hypothetical protein
MFALFIISALMTRQSLTRKKATLLEEIETEDHYINTLVHSSLDKAKYDKKKEAVLEEMEIEASKLEKDIEDDFGEGKFSMVKM